MDIHHRAGYQTLDELWNRALAVAKGNVARWVDGIRGEEGSLYHFHLGKGSSCLVEVRFVDVMEMGRGCGWE